MQPNDGRVVSNFIVQALRDEPITVFGDGRQTRSFCYVDDLVAAIVAFMQDDDAFPGPIKLGNPSEVTVRELAETIIRLTNSKSRVEYKPLPSDDPQRRRPDISLARQRLDWQPTTKLEDGLRKVIDYFDDRLKQTWQTT
jgi:UDP-glucuronate decarboxylase